jgi:hypothetical protein
MPLLEKKRRRSEPTEMTRKQRHHERAREKTDEERQGQEPNRYKVITAAIGDSETILGA